MSTHQIADLAVIYDGAACDVKKLGQWGARAKSGRCRSAIASVQTFAVTPPAQQVFKEMLRTIVAPALRERDLRGSGQSYLLPDDRMWAQVGFQQSWSSNRDAVRFTVNLNLTDKAAWDELRREHSWVKDTPPLGVDEADWDAERLAQSYFPKRPSITGGEGTRIGRLMPGVVGGDHWWVLTLSSTDSVHDALDAVLVLGLPWLTAGLGT